MKDWTRTPTDWADDPAVHALAGELKVDPAQAIGHLLNVWSMLPAHARDGRLAHVPPALLELWARWTKRRGTFAAAFARHILDADGLWVLWEDLNGAVLREKDSDRQRAADRRKALREEKERQLDLLLAKGSESGGQSAGPSAGASDATNGRNVPTAVTAGAHARRNGHRPPPTAYVPGHANLPATRFCEHCDGVLGPVPGSKRHQLVHTSKCPKYAPPPTPLPATA